MTARTLFDKVWDSHVIKTFPDGDQLVHVDRHFLIDLGSNVAFDKLNKASRVVHSPGLTFAVPDHIVATDSGRNDDTYPDGKEFVQALRRNAKGANIQLFDLDDSRQGIVHVVGPEQGIALPGCIMVTGDSHTSTMGGVGAVGFGIGTSELEHVLATQTLITRKPKRMRVTFEGKLNPGVTAKDMILYLIGHISASGGRGYALEYAGSAVRNLSVEARLTLCNMSSELGARVGMVAPDETTFEYVKGRPFAPKGELWDAAVDYWRALVSDDEALFDKEITLQAEDIQPQVTWGTSPMDVIAVNGLVPDPAQEEDNASVKAMQRAQDYMGLNPGTPMQGLKIDWAFIGSCTNSRFSDLEAAASVIKGRKVSDAVRAIVVPGSSLVKRKAEDVGLDKIFIDAGFEWHESGCSLCGAMNADKVGPGERCISTSNRNFEGRQGADARTHLASPAMVVAAAIEGCITDIRSLEY